MDKTICRDKSGSPCLSAPYLVALRKAPAIVVLVVSSIESKAQVSEAWVRSYEGLRGAAAFDMAGDDSGNVYISGATAGPVEFTGQDYVTLKYDSDGVLEWETTYNGSANVNDTPTSIAVDAAGNAYVTGESFGTIDGFDSARDYTTIKYRAGGAETWVQRFNGNNTFINDANDFALDIAVDDLGNVYVTGGSPVDGGTPSSCLTLKYDASGSKQWEARFVGSGSSSLGKAIEVDGLGNTYVLASGPGATGATDVILIKYDSAGLELWSRRYNADTTFTLHHLPTAMALDADGNVYATGGSSGSEYYTLKYSSGGEFRWVATHLGGIASAIAVDAFGNVFVTGSSQNPQATTTDYATIKYDSNGAEQWVARYEGLGGTSGTSGATAIDLDAFGNVYVTGNSEGADFLGSDGYDYGTVKYSSSGIEQWAARYNGVNASDNAVSIHVDADVNVYVTGVSHGQEGQEIVTIKYVQGSNIASEDDIGLSGRFLLKQNYPNPFSVGSTTRINWQTQADAHQSLTVFDVLGREVTVLMDAFLPAGIHEVTVDAARFQPGVYFYAILMGHVSEVKKMTVVR